jgi:chaperone required for assembly of F1-ATPase
MWPRRRFYRTAEAIAAGSGYAVALDGRPVRTPAGAPLVVPTAALAEAIAGEWREQPDDIRPEGLAMTRFAATAIDRVGPQRRSVLDQLHTYAHSDLLCYRAGSPADLAARQDAAWAPLLDWAAVTWGASLKVTTGLMPVEQAPAALSALAAALSTLDDFELTVTANLTHLCGSLIVALAVVHGRLDADGAFAAALLDEIYQTERWGEPAEVGDRRRSVRREIELSARFLAVVRRAVGEGPSPPAS